MSGVIAVNHKRNGSAIAVREKAPSVVAVKASVSQRVILAGLRGAIGRQGEIGPAGGSAFQRAAGEDMSALRVVYELDGEVFYLDYRDEAHINLVMGMTLTAAQVGEPINVQRSGFVDDTGWNWVPGPVWLGVAGSITQVPPSDGFDILLGAAVSATRITLNIQPPVELE